MGGKRFHNEMEEIKFLQELKELEKEEEGERMVFMLRRIYNHGEGKVELGLKTCTHIKTSRRVFFPLERPAKEKAGIKNTLQKWTKFLSPQSRWVLE